MLRGVRQGAHGGWKIDTLMSLEGYKGPPPTWKPHNRNIHDFPIRVAGGRRLVIDAMAGPPTEVLEILLEDELHPF